MHFTTASQLCALSTVPTFLWTTWCLFNDVDGLYTTAKVGFLFTAFWLRMLWWKVTGNKLMSKSTVFISNVKGTVQPAAKWRLKSLFTHLILESQTTPLSYLIISATVSDVFALYALQPLKFCYTVEKNSTIFKLISLTVSCEFNSFSFRCSISFMGFCRLRHNRNKRFPVQYMSSVLLMTEASGWVGKLFSLLYIH